MKKYLIPSLLILLAVGCMQDESELFQSYTEVPDVEVNISATNSVLVVFDLENSLASFTLDTVIGAYDKLETRVYFGGNNNTAILEDITNDTLHTEFKYSVKELATAIEYPFDDLKSLDKFSIEVVATVNGVTTTTYKAGFVATIITEDEVSGVYDVTAVSYYSPGAWDDFWTVLVYSTEEGGDTYYFDGVAGGSPIVGTVDLTTNMVLFTSGQSLGDTYSKDGDTKVVRLWGYDDDPIVGTRNPADSSLTINNWGHDIENVYFWDKYETTWVKR
jgi:hypothetical protein